MSRSHGHACCMLPTWNSTLTCEMNCIRPALAQVPTLRCTALSGAEGRSAHRAEIANASFLHSRSAVMFQYREHIQRHPAARVKHWSSEQDRRPTGATRVYLCPTALCQMASKDWCRKWGTQLGNNLQILMRRVNFVRREFRWPARPRGSRQAAVCIGSPQRLGATTAWGCRCVTAPEPLNRPCRR